VAIEQPPEQPAGTTSVAADRPVPASVFSDSAAAAALAIGALICRAHFGQDGSVGMFVLGALAVAALIRAFVALVWWDDHRGER
jgi:hypothetical protein